MMQPQFVDHVSRNGKVVELEPKVINERICIEATLDDRTCHVASRGGHRYRHEPEGSTLQDRGEDGHGTDRIRNGSYKANGVSYQASFVGYFPADAPKYSCIVVVNGPTMSGTMAMWWPVRSSRRSPIRSTAIALELQQETQLAADRGATHSYQYEWSCVVICALP
jgi:hypothetical protein